MRQPDTAWRFSRVTYISSVSLHPNNVNLDIYTQIAHFNALIDLPIIVATFAIHTVDLHNIG